MHSLGQGFQDSDSLEEAKNVEFLRSNEVACDVVAVQEAEHRAAAAHQEQEVNVQGDSTSARNARSRRLMRAAVLLE